MVLLVPWVLHEAAVGTYIQFWSNVSQILLLSKTRDDVWPAKCVYISWLNCCPCQWLGAFSLWLQRFSEFQFIQKKKKKLSNPCFLFDVKKYKCEVGMNRCMPLLGCRHTHSHTAKSRYSVYISQNGCVGLETSKGKCFLSSAMLLLQSTRPALQCPCLCWDSTCQTGTGVKQFMSSLKPNSGKNFAI